VRTRWKRGEARVRGPRLKAIPPPDFDPTCVTGEHRVGQERAQAIIRLRVRKNVNSRVKQASLETRC
jgi:hypothetical protein